MFEGKPPRPDDARAFDEKRDFDALRPLSWGDLVARLAEARGLRSSCEEPDPGGEASFDAGSARRIAALHNGIHDVNPEVSGNGKGPAGSESHAAFGAEPRALRK